MTSSQTIVLITGANQGIGYETAKNLLLSSPSPSSSPSQTYHVLLACRSLPRGLEAVETLRSLPSLRGTVEALQLDVTDDASVDAAARYVRETYWRVDVLVNNAGVGSLIRGNGGGVRDAMRKVLETNVVGAVSVTEAFMPLLLSYEEEGERVRRRKRLLFLCSTTGSFTYAGDPAHALRAAGGAMDYRTSKAALGMVVMQYYAQLRQKGVFVLGVNPGLIGTEGFHGGRPVGASPAVGGERVASVVRGERDADAGKIVQEMGVGGGGDVLPW